MILADNSVIHQSFEKIKAEYEFLLIQVLIFLTLSLQNFTAVEKFRSDGINVENKIERGA